MEEYQTENQQVEVIKQFIKRYQKVFLVGLLAIAVIVAVTRYWQQHTLQRAARASEVYQEMLFAEYKNDTKTLNAKGQFLEEEYANTPYAQFAALLLAKVHVNAKELDKAEEKLRWVIKQSSAKDVTSHLAKLRLAMILQEQEKFDEALKLLADSDSEAFASLYAEARGDVYLAMQDLTQAKESYLKAFAALPPGTQAPLLQMKLVDLGVDNNA